MRTGKENRQSMKTNLLLCMTVILMCFLVSEVVLRIVFREPSRPPKPSGWAIIPERTWITYDPDLGWTNRPDKEAVLEKNGNSVTIHTNSLGLRGTREYPPEPAPGIFRIFAVGDSFTFGFGVEDGDSFPAQLEAADPRLEVFNMGVPGYGVDQIFLTMRKWGTVYHPDLFVVTLYPEDFWRATRAFNDAGYGKPYFVHSNGGLELRHVPVPTEKRFSVNQFPAQYSRTSPTYWLLKSYLFRFSSRAFEKILKRLGAADPDSSPEWLLGRAILSETASYARGQGVPVLFVLAPPLRWITGTTEPVEQSFLRFCSKEQVSCLDLTPVMKEEARRQSADALYIPDDHHWTREGNRIAADAILAAIRDGKIPGMLKKLK